MVKNFQTTAKNEPYKSQKAHSKTKIHRMYITNIKFYVEAGTVNKTSLIVMLLPITTVVHCRLHACRKIEMYVTAQNMARYNQMLYLTWLSLTIPQIYKLYLLHLLIIQTFTISSELYQFVCFSYFLSLLFCFCLSAVDHDGTR